MNKTAPQTRNRSRLGMAWMGIASSAVAGQFFLAVVPGPAGWMPGAALLLMSALMLKREMPGSSVERHPLSARRERSLLAGILLVAALLRFWKLDSVPNGIFLDPGRIGWNALRILHEGFRPATSGPGASMPADYHDLLTPWFAVFKPDQVSLFGLVSLASLLGLPLIYLVFRQWAGNRQALVAIFILSVMRWHVIFSRNGYPENLMLPFMFLVLWAGRRAVESGQRRYFALVSLGLAGGLYTYQAFKVFPLLALVILAFEWKRDPRIRRERRRWFLAAGLSLVLALPVLVPLVKQGGLDKREAAVFILPRIMAEKSLRPLAANLAGTAALFNRTGDSNSQHNLPGHRMLDDATGALFVLGFFCALFRLDRREHLYPAMGVLVMSLPGVLSSAPDCAPRLIGTTPFVAFLASIPVMIAAKKLREAWGTNGSRVFAFLATVLLAGMLAQNAYVYFKLQAESFHCRLASGARETAIGRFVAERCPPLECRLDPWLYGHPTIRFLTYSQRDSVRELKEAEIEALGRRGENKGCLFVVPWANKEVCRKLLRAFPDGEKNSYVDYQGNPSDLILIIPAGKTSRP